MVVASVLTQGILRLPSSKRWPARVIKDGGGVRAHARHTAAAQQQGVSGIVVEAGGGVHAADGKLPLPSRRFMIPEVGRSWRY
ncbi:hypothetical protein PF011_g29856 [Phytophthora fragariae]|uniref:Uncharacterized protein n=1 Tax=Phytophthora fragariae TaxID=53985 RepID=A0A6A3GVN3_9STRA|nr:hypothetical protein PF011_g29856 [Phytophthora fragariae]